VGVAVALLAWDAVEDASATPQPAIATAASPTAPLLPARLKTDRTLLLEMDAFTFLPPFIGATDHVQAQ
jgi:hypothetical protein